MIKECYVVTAPKSVDPAGFLREQLEFLLYHELSSSSA